MQDSIPKFCGHDDSVILHILSFMEFISNIGIIHEDVVMRFFAHGLERSAREWFKHLGRGEISSFAGFVEAFCKKWSPNDHEEWMPMLKRIKEMYGVINKENLVEEAPHLLLKMMKPWKILLHLHLKNTMMKTLLTSPLKTKHMKKALLKKHLVLPWKTLMKTLKMKVPHASISPPHEVEGLVSFAPSQISEFDDLPCYDLERDNLEDKPLNNDEVAKACTSPFDEDNGTLGHEVMDITFQIFYHDRNWDCWKHYGDPIYDAYKSMGSLT
jgi:hypothetical protein